MELRVIPPQRKNPDKYESEETFIIPAKVLEIHRNCQEGNVVPIIIERLDFETGNLVKSTGITFLKSLQIFDDLDVKLPFYSNCIVSKRNGEIGFKVIGIYNAGFAELFYSVSDNILDNDERQIMNVFKSNYTELNRWVNKGPE